jgi:hypothetical protein
VAVVTAWRSAAFESGQGRLGETAAGETDGRCRLRPVAVRAAGCGLCGAGGGEFLLRHRVGLVRRWQGTGSRGSQHRRPDSQGSHVNHRAVRRGTDLCRSVCRSAQRPQPSRESALRPRASSANRSAWKSADRRREPQRNEISRSGLGRCYGAGSTHTTSMTAGAGSSRHPGTNGSPVASGAPRHRRRRL